MHSIVSVERFEDFFQAAQIFYEGIEEQYKVHYLIKNGHIIQTIHESVYGSEVYKKWKENRTEISIVQFITKAFYKINQSKTINFTIQPNGVSDDKDFSLAGDLFLTELKDVRFSYYFDRKYNQNTLSLFPRDIPMKSIAFIFHDPLKNVEDIQKELLKH